jgi:hypothetical protein
MPKRLGDDRGWFSETFSEQRLREAGITCHFVQDNQSSSRRAGTLRGFHFQVPPVAQAKLISVLRGHILDVAGSLMASSRSRMRCSFHTRLRITIRRVMRVGFAGTIQKLRAPGHSTMATSSCRTRTCDFRFLNEFASPFVYDGLPLSPTAVLNVG